MLKDAFSQESKVSREIDILFLRIFGRFELMTTISHQVQVTDCDKTDSLWEQQITSNIEYNSTSLGADIWDLVCRWNQDIIMARFWITIYTQANASRLRYFVEPMHKWNEYLTKLVPLITIFENCGGIDTGYILSKFKMQQQIEQHEDDVKNLRLENKKLVSKIESNKETTNKNIHNLQSLHEKEVRTLKNDIDKKKLESDSMQNKHSQSVRESENLKKQSDIALKLIVEQLDVSVKENQHLKSVVNHEKNVTKEKSDRIKTLEDQITAQEHSIQQNDVSLKLIQGNFEESVKKYENLKKDTTTALTCIQAQLAASVEKSAGLEENLVLSEKYFKTSQERNVEKQDIINDLKREAIDANDVTNKQSDKIKSMEAQITAQEDFLAQNLGAEKVEDLQKLLVMSEQELKTSQNRNHKQQEIINDLKMAAIDANDVTKKQSDKIKSMEDQITSQEDLLSQNVCAERVEDLQNQLVVSEQELNTSQERNNKQQEIINKLRRAAIEANNVTQKQSDKIKSMEDQLIAQEGLIARNVDAKSVEDLQTQLVISEQELKQNKQRNTILQNKVSHLNAEAINAASDTNYTRLTEEKIRLEEGNENKAIEIRRMKVDMQILWDQVIKSSAKGNDILNPQQIKKLMKDEHDKQRRPPAAKVAKGKWWGYAYGPSSYII